VGNESADFPVWAEARQALAANAPGRVSRRLMAEAKSLRQFDPQSSPFRAFIRALRCHQWSKNALVFLPLLAAHAYFSWPAVRGALLIFIAWCFVASGIYVSNDLLDLEADRRHPTKRLRPFARGDLPLSFGIFLAPT